MRAASILLSVRAGRNTRPRNDSAPTTDVYNARQKKTTYAKGEIDYYEIRYFDPGRVPAGSQMLINR